MTRRVEPFPEPRLEAPSFSLSKARFWPILLIGTSDLWIGAFPRGCDFAEETWAFATSGYVYVLNELCLLERQMSEKKARDLLWPTDTRILLRFVFLNVGQGSSTIVLVRSGETYKTILVDINLDAENEGIDVPALIADLLDGDNLEVFVNTHPHSDHLRGISELADTVKINEVWHSGHKPGPKHNDAYKNLKKVIETVVKDGGEDKETVLEASPDKHAFGDASYYILSPKESLTDEVQDDEQDERYARIHEQCAVLRFGAEPTWVLLPGDADREAFKTHVMKSHEGRLPSIVLAASHHGSRTFFKAEEDDEPYRKALDAIAPERVVISAPRQAESEYDHPHDDAVEIYEDEVGTENVFHTGLERHSFIFDILDDETRSEVTSDNAELRLAYPLGDGDDDKDRGTGFTPRKRETTIGGGRYAR